MNAFILLVATRFLNIYLPTGYVVGALIALLILGYLYSPGINISCYLFSAGLKSQPTNFPE